jgi:2-iminobutanoate/2-iminopropanoate deaminase
MARPLSLLSDPTTRGVIVQTTKSNPQGVHPPVGTYSHAVRVEGGDATWIYVSGQVALDAEGTLVAPNDLRAQTKQVFENLTAILEANGATFEDVVKITTFVTTLDDLDGMREVRARYLPKEPPASTAVQISALVLPDAVIEIEAVAVIAS